MYNILVLQHSGEICRLLADAADKAGSACNFSQTCDRYIYDLVLCMDKSPEKEINCGILVLPSSRCSSAVKIKCSCAVSFGLYSRDTVTLSAIIDQRILSLQREIFTLSGRTVYPGEMVIDSSLMPEDALAFYTVALICEIASF